MCDCAETLIQACEIDGLALRDLLAELNDPAMERVNAEGLRQSDGPH
jgi:hypothetical protein